MPIADIEALANRLGWPVLADPTSGCRGLEQAITAFDSLLRHSDFARAHAPELVVRFGRPPASKLLSQWIVAAAAPVLQVGGPGVIDPDHNVVGTCSVADLGVLSGAAGTPWLARWRHANMRAEQAIDLAIAELPVSEPGVARTIATAIGPEVELVVASSMPVRDLEWFGGSSARAHSNRGANGIDGVISTALGRAMSGRSTVVLVGDIAFAHDSNALLGLAARRLDLRVVVIDNGGGGIFSFLPQATQLDPARFEQLFGTPHGTDIEALASAHGIAARTVSRFDDLAAAVRTPGPSVTRVVTDRADNVRHHDLINAAVAGCPAMTDEISGRAMSGESRLADQPVDEMGASTRSPCPVAIPGSLSLCGKHAIAPRFGVVPGIASRHGVASRPIAPRGSPPQRSRSRSRRLGSRPRHNSQLDDRRLPDRATRAARALPRLRRDGSSTAGGRCPVVADPRHARPAAVDAMLAVRRRPRRSACGAATRCSCTAAPAWAGPDDAAWC